MSLINDRLGGGASKDVNRRVSKAWSKWRELSGVICDKKIPTKVKLHAWQQHVATTETRLVRWAMWVSLLEHRRNKEILEEAKVKPIATVMGRRRLECFGHVKRRNETENNRAVVEMKMEGKRPRGRPKLRWKHTVRRDLKSFFIRLGDWRGFPSSEYAFPSKF